MSTSLRRQKLEAVVCTLLNFGIRRADVAQMLGIPGANVDYIRRKHGIPGVNGRGGVRREPYCKYGHPLKVAATDYYVVRRSSGITERRCKRCKHFENANRKRGRAS